MPQVHTITTYKLSELSEKARAKAIEAVRSGEGYMSWEWYDSVYDDFANICNALGITITTRPGRGFGGSTIHKPAIYFSGFSSQGDGACFECDYSYKKGSVKAVRSYAPKDEKLHRIAKGLADVQKRYFYQLTATSVHSGHYYHSGCMSVAVRDGRTEWGDCSIATDQEVTQLLRDLADWLYRALEREYDDMMTDEYVADHIAANAYDFTEDGSVWN